MYRDLEALPKQLALSYSQGEGSSFFTLGEIPLRSFPFLILPPCH